MNHGWPRQPAQRSVAPAPPALAVMKSPPGFRHGLCLEPLPKRLGPSGEVGGGGTASAGGGKWKQTTILTSLAFPLHPLPQDRNPRLPQGTAPSPTAPRSASPPQGKSLNGGMNVNGFSTVSHASTSGTFAPSSPPAGTPPLRPYDCLWDYAPYPPAGGLKDSSPPAPPALQPRTVPTQRRGRGGPRPASPGHGTNLRGAGQEFWGQRHPWPHGAELRLAGAVRLLPRPELRADAERGRPASTRLPSPSPMLGSGSQPFSLPPDEPGAGDGDADAAAKELPPAITENGGGLVGSLELEEAQPDLKICGYNGSVPGAVPLGQEGPVLPPGGGQRLPGGHVAHRPAPGGHPHPQRRPPGALRVPGTRPRHRGPLHDGRLAAGDRQVPPGGAPRPALRQPPPSTPPAPSACCPPAPRPPRCSPAPPRPPPPATVMSPAGRIATQEEVRFPLQHGWRREVRIKKGNHRWQGETWYYGPCGKRMKQFPEVIKYLSRNVVQDVRREHFSFSPRIAGGRFLRGAGHSGGSAVKMVDLLSKTDARLLKRLEAQEVLSDEDKLKMSKIKKKMRRKAKNKQKQEAKAPRAKEAKKKSKAKEKKSKPEKGKDKARPKEKKGKGPRKADKGLVAQRRLEERRRQQLILEEMKKPTEDMCLGDHQPLPAFSPHPGPHPAQPRLLQLPDGRGVPPELRQGCALRPRAAALLPVPEDPGGEGVGDQPEPRHRLRDPALLPDGVRGGRGPVRGAADQTLPGAAAGEESRHPGLPGERAQQQRPHYQRDRQDPGEHVQLQEEQVDHRGPAAQVEGGPGQEDGTSRVRHHGPGGRAAPAQLPPDRGDRPGDGGGGGDPRTEIPQGGGGRHVCVQRPRAREADREAGQEADVLSQEAAPFLADAASGFAGPGPGTGGGTGSCPHLGGIFVEGAEVADPAAQEPPEEKASPHVSPVKEEPVDVPVPSRTNCTASRSPWPAPQEQRGAVAALRAQAPPRQRGPGGVGATGAEPARSQPVRLPLLAEPDAVVPAQGLRPHPRQQPRQGGHGAPAARGPVGPHRGGKRRREEESAPGGCRKAGTLVQPPAPDALRRPSSPRCLLCRALATSPPRSPGASPAATCPRARPDRDAERLVVGAGPRGAGGGGSRAAPAWHPGESAAQAPHQAQGVPAGDLPAQHHRPHLPPAPRGGRRRRVSGSPGPVVGDGESLRDRPLRAAVGGGAGAARADGRPADPGLDVPRPRLHAGRPCGTASTRWSPWRTSRCAGRRDGLPLRRERTNPLDLAVLRLAALEQNVERRYLKEPLWPLHEVVVEKAVLSGPEELSLGPTEIAYEITPRVRTWRQTLERCRSAAQVSLCIYQLEKSIAWEKSVNRVTCLVCRRGDDDEHLLLCDGCDRGCHLYCHRPKMTEVPEGDWFCSVCVSRYRDPVSPRRGKKRKRGRLFAGSVAEEEESPRRRPASRRREGLPPAPRYTSEGLSPAKRRGATLRGPPSDLTFCEIILMEMESHEDAWPLPGARQPPPSPRLPQDHQEPPWTSPPCARGCCGAGTRARRSLRPTPCWCSTTARPSTRTTRPWARPDTPCASSSRAGGRSFIRENTLLTR
ncbi:unnamed protein product, partial [Bubo scandiacus]